MIASGKKIVINDSYFLTNLVFGCLKSDDTEVFELKNEPEKNNIINRIISIILKKRIFPWLFILILAFNRRFIKKRNQHYELLLTVGVEDLSRLSKIYSCYYAIDKLIYWQWNPSPKSNFLKKIDFMLRIKLIKIAGFTVYTFDHDDSKKYDLHYYPQIYSRALAYSMKNRQEPVKGTVFFVGDNKGRVDKLKFISGVMKKLDLKPDFYVLDNKNEISSGVSTEGLQFISELMDYKTSLSMIDKAEYLLEVTQAGQSGLTLRTLESLFFGKKLITDNSSIHMYDFFNPANIYIIDYHKKESVIIDEIERFKLMNYEDIEDSTLNKYDVKSFFEHVSSDDYKDTTLRY